MSDNTSNNNDKPTFSHYSTTDRAIFKGFTKNDAGTYFASISLPTGQVDNKQTYINVSAIVGNSAALKSLASSMCGLKINDGKGTSAEVTITNMRGHHSFDKDGNIRLDPNGYPFINYSAFLNGIAFS